MAASKRVVVYFHQYEFSGKEERSMAGAYAPGVYAPTHAIWLPLVAAAFEAVLGLYCWRRRDLPAVRPLLYVFAFTALYCLAGALSAAATSPATKIAWFKVGQASVLPAFTAGTCFVLEYVYPGRWLTRRNLALLALPPLLLAVLIFAGNGQFVWETLAIGPGGSVLREPGTVGRLVPVYVLGLTLLNVAALLWLFVHSPLHRWPVALMLAGQIAGRIPAYVDALRQPWTPSFDFQVAAILIWSAFYAVAVLGFRILDPVPAARQAVLEQMHAAVVVFDPGWRILSLNPAAEAIVGVAAHEASGKTWLDVVPSAGPLPQVPLGPAASQGTAMDLPEVALGSGMDARDYAPALSSLRDFRGLLLGYLLMLRDVTEHNRAQAQALEQQRVLATLRERERLARELHDSLGQVLAAAHLQANSARRWLQQGQYAQADETLGLLADTTLEAETDVRDYLLGAKTMMSAERPFFPSLREYLQRFSRQYGLRAELSVPPDLEAHGLPAAVEVQLFRIIQEALSNVRKHAGATCAQVAFSQTGPQLLVTIRDDGRGLDPGALPAAGQTYGLQAMTGRAAAVGGSLEILSQPGDGTQVVVRIPQEAEA